MQWYRLASHLHLPIQDVQARTTSSEFVEWMRYLDEDVNQFHREDYYLAQIAAEVRRGNAKHPRRIKVEDCLLRFVTEQDKRRRDRQARDGDASKAFWLAAVGVKHVQHPAR